MKNYHFKTNINCGGCIAVVTPFFDKNPEIKSWKVDITNPDKILTVETESLSEDAIKSIVIKAGYKAEAVNS